VDELLSAGAASRVSGRIDVISKKNKEWLGANKFLGT
jgi:hypothetical protein